MKYTDKLGLPIWNKPETDVFDIEQFNEGMQAVDDIIIHILNQINDLVIGDTKVDLNEYVKEKVFEELKEKVENKVDKEEVEQISSQLDTKANKSDVETINSKLDTITHLTDRKNVIQDDINKAYEKNKIFSLNKGQYNINTLTLKSNVYELKGVVFIVT